MHCVWPQCRSHVIVGYPANGILRTSRVAVLITSSSSASPSTGTGVGTHDGSHTSTRMQLHRRRDWGEACKEVLQPCVESAPEKEWPWHFPTPKSWRVYLGGKPGEETHGLKHPSQSGRWRQPMPDRRCRPSGTENPLRRTHYSREMHRCTASRVPGLLRRLQGVGGGQQAEHGNAGTRPNFGRLSRCDDAQQSEGRPAGEIADSGCLLHHRLVSGHAPTSGPARVTLP